MIEEQQMDKPVIISKHIYKQWNLDKYRTYYIEFFILLYKPPKTGPKVCLVWVPSHMWIEGNEDVDILAKQPLISKGADTLPKFNKSN